MKLTYNWIKDYCDINMPAQELADKLTSVGLVVEEISEVNGDYCLDMEVTANRADCLGMLGIAREARAVIGCNVKLPEAPVANTGQDAETTINVQDKDLCPRYTAQIIKGVKIGPSPKWLQDRLTGIGLRPVNNVVDITNFVLMETGQPLHAFDLDKLNGNEIIIRAAKNGEKIAAIDGTNHTLNSEMLVIADAKQPVAIAGVMGGLDTEVSGNTKNILLECARFDPACVRKTSKKLVLSSDSSYRFERGVDPENVMWASNRAANLIKDIAGGEVTSIIDQNFETQKEARVNLRISRIKRVLGIEIAKDTAKGILERLGFEIASETDDSIDVNIPSFRPDVYREIDLIEEVIRIYGYDKIPVKTNISLDVVNKKTDELAIDKIRHLLTGLGLFETVTFSIVEKPDQNFDAKVWTDEDNLMIQNPLIKAEDRMRKTLLFNFLKIKKHNQDRGVKDVNIFEVSNIYIPAPGADLPNEKRCIGLLVEKDFPALKGLVESVLGLFNVRESCVWTQKSFKMFSNEKSAVMELDGVVLGYLGELGKDLCNAFDINGTCCFAEIDLDRIIDGFEGGVVKEFQALPEFPGITRDVAIVLDENVKWGDIANCVKSANAQFFEGLEFFDVFRGKQVEPGKKSMAFSVKFSSRERTLKGEEADESIKNIINKLSAEFGAKLRQ